MIHIFEERSQPPYIVVESRESGTMWLTTASTFSMLRDPGNYRALAYGSRLACVAAMRLFGTSECFVKEMV